MADIAVVWAGTDDGIRGFLVPRGTRGFTTRNIHKKLSLRASVTCELHFDDVKLPATAVLPGVTGPEGPALVPVRSPVRHLVGCHRRRQDLLRDRR